MKLFQVSAGPEQVEPEMPMEKDIEPFLMPRHTSQSQELVLR